MADINLGVGGANSAVAGGYNIANSLKLEEDNSEYLYKTNDTGTNRKTFTVSMWFKRTELTNDYMTLWQGGVNGEATRLGFFGGTPKEAIWVDIGGGSGNTGTLYRSYSNQVLKDTSAFYHIVLAVDTTQATEANRFRLWLNGEEVTSWSQRQYPAQNFECALEASINMNWGAYNATYYKMCGYIAECHYLDGVAKVQTDFGEFDADSGIWKPKAYTGSYGGNGCYLDFSDAANLGDDVSGNSNNFTLNNITSADQAVDTPTNNFCTMNFNDRRNGNIKTQEGGTYVTTDGGSGWCSMNATMAVGSGKWYWEALYFNNGDADDVHIGVAPANDRFIPHNPSGYYLGNVETGGSMGWDLDGGTNYNQNGSWGNPSRGDKLMVALDMDNYKLYYGINGTWGNSADPANGTGSVTSMDTYWMSEAGALDFVHPSVSVYQGNYMKGFNFGGYCAWTIASAASDDNGYGNFEYAPPSGFYALCTKNLAEYG